MCGTSATRRPTVTDGSWGGRRYVHGVQCVQEMIFSLPVKQTHKTDLLMAKGVLATVRGCFKA